MGNVLLEIGTPSGRRWLVIALFLVITWNLLGTPPDFLNVKTVIFGSIKVGLILAGLLWLTFLWIKRHVI